MKSNVKDLRDRIKDAEKELAKDQKELQLIVKNCDHLYGPTQPDHIYQPGGMTPGDPPGTMGIDFRGPEYIPSKTIKQWRRECQECGKVEYTRGVKTTTHTITKPRW